jgi:hypothetical protein
MSWFGAVALPPAAASKRFYIVAANLDGIAGEKDFF